MWASRPAAFGGLQRPVGRFFPDTPAADVPRHAPARRRERLAYRYGHDKERDIAGLLQRIGERRWRLVLPRRISNPRSTSSSSSPPARG
jgi:hypothetical protein